MMSLGLWQCQWRRRWWCLTDQMGFCCLNKSLLCVFARHPSEQPLSVSGTRLMIWWGQSYKYKNNSNTNTENVWNMTTNYIQVKVPSFRTVIVSHTSTYTINQNSHCQSVELGWWSDRDRADRRFVQNFTPPDFQAKNFTPSISPNFNSFSDKNTNKISENWEIYTACKNLPPAVTAWINLTSGTELQKQSFKTAIVSQWNSADDLMETEV